MTDAKVNGNWSVRDIPKSKHSIKCPHPMTPIGIVMHNTANSAPASNEISYMHSNNNQVSYHFAVDENEAIQGLPLNRNGWHAGDGGSGPGNRKHIGVEIARSTDQTPGRFAKAERRSAAVVAKLLQKYGWGIGQVKAHRDFMAKNCPHRTDMNTFKKMVQDAMSGKQPTNPAAQNTNTKPSTGSSSSNTSSSSSSGSVKVGAKVKITGSKYSTGQTIPAWVKNGTHVVSEVKGAKALLGKNGGINSWVNTKDLSVQGGSTAAAPAATTKTATITATALNVRTGPSTGYKVLGVLKKGNKVTVKGEKNGWLNITYSGKNAYISKKYATVATSTSTTTSTTTAPKPAATKTATITATALNVRTGPSTNYKVLGVLKKGNKVTVKGEKNGWLNITYSGKNAYISKKYASVGTGAATTPTNTNTTKPATKSATITASSLNVRSGAGTGYKILGTLKKGNKVNVKGEKSGWLNITYSGKNAYISKQYTSLGSGGGGGNTAPPVNGKVSAAANTAASRAESMMSTYNSQGWKYNQGKRTTNGFFDCSSFVGRAWENTFSGLKFKNSEGQALQFKSKEIKGANNIQRGDLLFYHSNWNSGTRWKGINHVAIAVSKTERVDAGAAPVRRYTTTRGDLRFIARPA